ncbi:MULTISPECIES: hypothetical protein [Streptacidiphilus]|uniref:Uncharacterized protein n=1 Tax=Streptacidiphilus cavernicola TaxID=3342716 RepID=A0ABV6UWJ4_9ACTN|nr:hypothetical protein [Streptacidiphilus jeojiense]
MTGWSPGQRTALPAADRSERLRPGAATDRREPARDAVAALSQGRVDLAMLANLDRYGTTATVN